MSPQQENFRIQKWVVAVAVILFIIKVTAWMLTQSVAILTDALESTVNVIAGFIGLYSLYVAAKPRDEDHPYGHGKAEFISAGVEGTLILVAGFIIIYESISNFIHPHPIQKLDYGIILVAITAAVNFVVGYIAIRNGKKNNSLALTASGKHLQTDTYSTVGIIAGLALLFFTGWVWLDSVVAIIFAFIIIYTGYRIIRTSIGGIMDEADSALLSKLVITLNENRKENWIDLHNLRVIRYGGQMHIDCHITVPWYLNVNEAHIEIDALIALIKTAFGDSVEFLCILMAVFIRNVLCVAKEIALYGNMLLKEGLNGHWKISFKQEAQAYTMNYRKFGSTDLMISEAGFGAWAIGGPAFAGTMPIGWGNTNDKDSLLALRTAFERGINFYDTADFYGLGHSEELIGKVFGNSDKVIIASKIGQKLGKEKPVEVDYSKQYIIEGCERSLKRLKRDCIDYYQLHVANIGHLQQGDCIEAMLSLQQQGKIRYWGISLFTFNPFPEAEYIMQHQLGNGFQLVFNIINQKALPLLEEMHNKGYGIIARMPLQFGLLAGKFTALTQFDESDHRSFRLTPEIIARANETLQPAWSMAGKYETSKAALALSFILSFTEITTVIPGIRTAEQAILNTKGIFQLLPEDRKMITGLYESSFEPLLKLMQQQG